MSDLFDYSGIPKFEEKWYLSEKDDHWIELKIDERGLTYVGCDYGCQSGGYYMAGFQTFDEFFNKGSIKDMPIEIETKIKEYLEAHRREGGARLVLKHFNQLKDLVLWRAFINLDEKTIKITTIEQIGEASEITFYDGAILTGEHTISFLLIFKERGKVKESDPLWRIDGEIPISIDPKLEPKTVIKLTTNRENPEGQIITRID
jgi:hypothetical protein